MRSNIVILWILAIFFLICSGVYTYWHMLTYQGEIEWVGTIGFGLCAVLGAFVGFYLGLVNRSLGGVLPEDTLTADIDDGDPEIGHFAPWSWWPIALAGAIALTFMGLAISVFLVPIGAALCFIMLAGWVFEYYRGNFTR